MPKMSVYLKLELRIVASGTDDIVRRWRYGRKLLAAKAGRRQLPHGMIEGLIKEASSVGIEVSRREIQYRIKCATVYGSEAEVRTAACALRSWTELRDADFPSTRADEPDEMEAAGIPTGPPDEFEQLTLIPGAPEVLRVKGRQPVVLADATLLDFKAYCEQSAEITKNFARRDDQLWSAYRAMREVTDDMTANAVETYRRASKIPAEDA